MIALQLTPDERRRILREYFQTKESGISFVSCPHAVAPPVADGWDDRAWYLYMPNGRGGYVADYAFIEWVQAHRRFAWTMRIPFTILLVVLFGLFHAWHVVDAVGWWVAGAIFIAGFASLQLLLSWLYTLPTTLRVRRMRYVTLPADLADEIVRIDGSAELARAVAGGLAGELPSGLGIAAERLADRGIDWQRDEQIARTIDTTRRS